MRDMSGWAIVSGLALTMVPLIALALLHWRDGVRRRRTLGEIAVRRVHGCGAAD